MKVISKFIADRLAILKMGRLFNYNGSSIVSLFLKYVIFILMITNEVKLC